MSDEKNVEETCTVTEEPAKPTSFGDVTEALTEEPTKTVTETTTVTEKTED